MAARRAQAFTTVCTFSITVTLAQKMGATFISSTTMNDHTHQPHPHPTLPPDLSSYDEPPFESLRALRPCDTTTDRIIRPPRPGPSLRRDEESRSGNLTHWLRFLKWREVADQIRKRETESEAKGTEKKKETTRYLFVLALPDEFTQKTRRAEDCERGVSCKHVPVPILW